MTKNREFMYWHTNPDWYVYDENEDTYTIKDDAPERAKISFDMCFHPEKYGICIRQLTMTRLIMGYHLTLKQEMEHIRR